MIQFRDTTKMGLQAALSIAIAEFLNLYFNFEKGYWIALTAMALTTQTWGESAKRALERIGMTILGGIVGTIMYFALPANPHLHVGVILIFVFLSVYVVKNTHLMFIFFLTCVVVFMFALIGKWNFDLLEKRIVDTILGALIALCVGFFFFPLKRNIHQLLIFYFNKMNTILIGVFNFPVPMTTRTASDYLNVDLQKIKKEAIGLRLELLFHRLSSTKFYQLLNHLDNCTKYMSTLISSYRLLYRHLDKEQMAMVREIALDTEKNIEILLCHFKKNKENKKLSQEKVTNLILSKIKQNSACFGHLKSKSLGFFSVLHFFAKMNEELIAIDNLMHGDISS